MLYPDLCQAPQQLTGLISSCGDLLKFHILYPSDQAEQLLWRGWIIIIWSSPFIRRLSAAAAAFFCQPLPLASALSSTNIGCSFGRGLPVTQNEASTEYLKIGKESHFWLEPPI